MLTNEGKHLQLFEKSQGEFHKRCTAINDSRASKFLKNHTF